MSFDEHSALSAPFCQVFFLLGLMLTTPEPARPRDFGEDEWDQSVDLLDTIVNAYASMFWPTPDELPDLTDAWFETREVAMRAFLHHMGATLRASAEQVAERIRTYIAPFDEELRQTCGLTASEALEVTDWIAQTFQLSADQLSEVAAEELRIRLLLRDRAQREGWDLNRLRKETQNGTYPLHAKRLIDGLRSFLRISRAAIQDQFGERIALSYWKQFACHRGEVQDFRYLTERNVADEKPLFEVAKEVALCVSVNALYEAILKVGEDRLSSGEKRELFFRKRDRALEKETEEKMRVLFGRSADFFAHAFETETGDFEHDLIIRWDRRLFVIEAKAMPPAEPFRDPDKAFTRLKRAFQSDRGIQKAYEQADRVRGNWAAGNPVDFYNAHGNQLAHIEPSDVDAVYCVCVTRDDFGPLAVDLSLLLKKDELAPYPWAINILDLGNLVDAWGYFGWGPEKLCEYLDDRVRLNGRVLVSDELDLVGYFIQHGGLSTLLQATCDRAIIDPTYSAVIDKIYLARHGGEPVEYAPTEPIMRDLREAMADLGTDSDGRKPAPRAPPKQGRNDPCACGSGRKYKKCCGRRA